MRFLYSRQDQEDNTWKLHGSNDEGCLDNKYL